MTRTATRSASRAVGEALRKVRAASKTTSLKTGLKPTSGWTAGVAIGPALARRYYLFKPPGVRGSERLPLMVMLHGCGQNAEEFAASTKMHRLAAAKRFLVLYPEQDRLSNTHACWNWYGTRSGRAQREADSIDAAIDQVCRLQPVDKNRVTLAGLSAGASMAAFLAARHPERYRTVAMHSGIAPGVANSSAGAFKAMQGRKTTAPPLPAGARLPALLVIQGGLDHVVAPRNGAEAANQWATQAGAKPGAPRSVQRGTRHTATITDYRTGHRLVATLCEIDKLGHAWSGGAPGHAYSDPKGPDASRMIWSFAEKQFTQSET